MSIKESCIHCHWDCMHFLNEHSINWTSLMAAVTIFMISILIIFLIGQKQFVEGISTSGLKG